MARNQNDEYLQLPDDSGKKSRIGNSAGVLTSANGTNTVTISNLAPTGAGTATINSWLNITIDGVTYFIPMWT